VDMNPPTSAFVKPASARALVVPWWMSSRAVLSSTRPQSDNAAPTMATLRFMCLAPRSSLARSSSGFRGACSSGGHAGTRRRRPRSRRGSLRVQTIRVLWPSQ